MIQEPFRQDDRDYSKQDLEEFHRIYRTDGVLQVDSMDSQGYGDILRTISYTQKLQRMLREKVRLRFFVEEFFREETRKVLDEVRFSRDFPEPQIISHPNIMMTTNETVRWLRYRRAKSVFDWMGYPDLELKRPISDGGHLVVWNSNKNLEYPPRWKDPVHPNYMKKIAMSTGKKIKMVNYRMPVDYVFRTIATSSFCIGYEGMGNVIAYNYRKPMVVFSESPIISRNTSGPWAHVTPRFTQDLVDNLDNIIDEQRVKINESKETSQD